MEEQNDSGEQELAGHGKSTRLPPIEGEPQACITQAKTDAKQNAEITKLDDRAERRERLTLVVAIVGVLIAAGSVWVSERQRQIMQGQLNDARKAAADSDKKTNQQLEIWSKLADAAQLDQRAWVAPEDLIGAPQKGSADWNVTMSFRNVGRTPALNVGCVLLPANKWRYAAKL